MSPRTHHGTSETTRFAAAHESATKRVLDRLGIAIDDHQTGLDGASGTALCCSHPSFQNYYLPGPVDVKAIRKCAGMSKVKFAAAFALNPRALQG